MSKKSNVSIKCKIVIDYNRTGKKNRNGKIKMGQERPKKATQNIKHNK